MKEIDFKWTDELVMEYALILRHKESEGKVIWASEVLQDFKSDRTPEVKRDWEIIEFEYVANNVTLIIPKKYTTGLFTNGFEDMTEHQCLSRGCHIRSVRRLSDGLLFNVGDNCFHGPIVRFNLRDNQITADFEHGDVGCSKLLSELSKPLQRTPIFKTEDGKDIFEGDKWWSVWVGDGSYDISDSDTIRKYDPNFKGKRFSTEEKAKEYVILNKPCLSVNDVIEAFEDWKHENEFFEDYIKQFAKQKLDKQ